MGRQPFFALGVVICLMSAKSAAQTQPVDRNSLVGSDTMNHMIDTLLPNIQPQAPEGLLRYQGLGSLVGQRQMEGDLASGDPSCGWASTGDNPGCQEIAPMTSLMTSDICDDAEAAGEAESLLMAKDGLLLLTSNAARQQYSTGSCLGSVSSTPNPNGVFVDDGTGHLKEGGNVPGSSGYVLGSGFSASDAWKDAARLLFTGCAGGDGSCTTSVNRTARCGSSVRRALVSDWGNVLAGESCDLDRCEGVSHIYRRDDNSSVAREFLDRLGVDANELASRSTVLNGGGFPAQIGATPEDFPFCDGGMDEQYNASSNGSDPVRVPCEADADLCGADGQTGLVQAVRSPEGLGYPRQQCGRSLFARVPWTISGRAVCPDGTVPSGGLCNLPYRLVGGERDFDCINSENSRPLTLPGVDGRVYNAVERDADGNVRFLGNGYPVLASYRQDMVEIDAGFGAIAGKTYSASDVVCQEADATRLIACLVTKDACSLGLTSRGGAAVGPHVAGNEPLVLGGSLPNAEEILNDEYPLASEMYLAAIGGFEDLNEDCEDRGHRNLSGADDYCFAQYEVAIASYVMSPPVQSGVSQLGYVPIPMDYPNRCVGAMSSAGCGAPTSQPLSACEPIRPSDRPGGP